MRGIGAGLAACALLGTALTGCTPTDAPTPLPAPTGVSVSINQDRLYIAKGEASIVIANAGSDAISLASVSYSTSSLTDAIAWSGQLRIPAGSKRSVTFAVPGTDCAGDPAETGTARIAFTTPAGATSADYAVDDPYGFLGRHQAAECFAQKLAATASVEITDVTTKTTDAGLVAVLTVTATVHGDQGIRLDSVKSTTLLQPAGGGWTWEPATTVEPGHTASVLLEAVPARCDLHAIAEDKVGTRFDTTAELLGEPAATGTLTLVASDAQRGALFDYVVAACGSPTP
ncbi:hypothetical protein [Microbacterium rhizomatis]|uniref:Uncharacterized protein n=1 Tax=Microbacterium rhizomatis TaxID=1631477 RepID=A0A5J5J2W9_9MICO|nr:hypothetical protein [Microbacterium rhizomatis]KAA9110262.1 hypothetical protein F6B43_00735 [Microbacterium rhizomatis]